MQAEQRTLFGSGIGFRQSRCDSIRRAAALTAAPVQGLRRRAHCTLRAVEGTRDRKKTLETLIELAGSTSNADCWNDERAESLLRSQSSAGEARALGMSEAMIDRVFGREPAPDAQGRSNAHSHQVEPSIRSPLPDRFTVRVEARFESAHYLREYRGISEPLHGHSYKVEAELAAEGGGVDADAIAVDFVSAKRKLEALAKTLDYGCINEVAPFDRINPSAENLAEWFHGELSAAVKTESAVVRSVTIWEGPVNSVTFRPHSH